MTGPVNLALGRHRTGDRYRSIRLLGDGLAGLALLLIVNIVAGPTGFWSADEAVAHQQVDLLATGRWAEPVPEPALDPEGRWHTLSPLSLGEDVVGPYVKHPVFPALVRSGDMIGGSAGRFAVPALASVVAALLIAHGAERRRPGSARMSYWLALGGTPLLFHGTMMWAHSLAVAAIAGACLILQSRMSDRTADQASDRACYQGSGPTPPVRGNPTRPHLGRSRTVLVPLGFALLVAFAVLLRSEAAIFTTLLGLGLIVSAVIDPGGGNPDDGGGVPPDQGDGATRVRSRRWRLRIRSRRWRLRIRSRRWRHRPIDRPLLLLGITSVVVTFGAYLIDGLLREAILGPSGDVALDVPPEPLLDLRVRGALIWRWLVGARAGNGVGIGRIIGTILLVAAAHSARPDSRASLSPWLGLAGGLLFVPALLSESAVAFGPAAPAVVVGLVIFTAPDRFARYVLVLSVVYFAAVVAASYANGGGGDWGGRYLALLLAPLAIVGLPELWRLSRHPDLRPLFIGVVVASAALTVSMSLDVIHARRNTTALLTALNQEVENMSGPGILVVTTDSRIGRLLGTSQSELRLLQVPSHSMQQLADRLPAGEELLIIDLLDPYAVPDSWTVVDRSPYATRVRPADS